ncbi:MAG: OmpH family outer membrane protein [Planctomycetota bacterium]
MKAPHLAILAAVVLVMSVGISAVRGQSGAAPQTSIAVVDVEAVFGGLKSLTAFEAEQSAEGAALNRELEIRSAAARAMQSDLELLTPGTEAHADKENELRLAALELRVWQQFEQERLARESIVELERTYRDIADTINRIATERGIDAVLFDQPLDELVAENRQQLLAQIADRKLLFASERIDLTDAVIRRMNNDFDAAR